MPRKALTQWSDHKVTGGKFVVTLPLDAYPYFMLTYITFSFRGVPDVRTQ